MVAKEQQTQSLVNMKIVHNHDFFSLLSTLVVYVNELFSFWYITVYLPTP